MRRNFPWFLAGLVALLLVSGCRGTPSSGEKTARRQLAEVRRNWLAEPPPLTPHATLAEVVRFAVQHHPDVRAAYEDWAAGVENITVARSLPDPKLTFQAYVQDSLTSLMPGLVQDLPGYGKRAARAAAASADSQAKYFQFVATVQQTAFGVEKTYYPLHFLDAKLAVNRQQLDLLAEWAALARAQDVVSQGTLPEVLQAQMEQQRLQTETADLQASRALLLAQFRAALGLDPAQSDPPVPADPGFTDPRQDDGPLLADALKQNPRLQELAADLRSAEAAIAMSRREQSPDFSAGLQAEVYSPPFYWPQASMSLPIWRDKLAAGRAAAQAGLRAARSRLTSGQINLVVEFAEKSYLVHSADRQLVSLRTELLPRVRQSLAVARAVYPCGQAEFSNMIEAERALLDIQLEEIAAQTQRELARAELVLIVAGVNPESGSPPH